MANSDKDILITPNKGTTSLPELSFIGQVNSPIKLRVLDDNTLSFEGSAGQLFSINNNLTTGTIFAVSDVSGVPSLSVDANGALKLVPFNGVAMVGGTTTATSPKLVTVQPNAGTRYSLQIQVNSGIVDGQYDGIGFTQDASGATPLGGIRVEYRSNGNPDLGFYTRSGGATESRKLLIYNGGNVSVGGDFASYSRLNVLGGSGITIRADSSSTTNRYIYFRQAPNDYGFRITQDDSAVGMLFFRAVDAGNDTNPLITLDRPTLRVGIGQSWSTTTRPGYTLDVNGDVNFSGNLYQGGSIFKTLPTQSATTIGSILKSDGTNAYWAASTPEDVYLNGFQISRGYAMAGYQNSTSYRNVCSINHSAITLTNHGDLLTNGQGYCAGGRDKLMNGYVFIAVNGVGGTGSSCSKINMNNNTNAGTTNISISRSSTTIMQRDFKFAYVYGGGDSRPDKFNYTNNTSALIANGNPEGNVNNPAGGYGAQFGWTKNGAGYNFSWATESYSTWSGAPGTDGSNKTLSARANFAYWNTAGGYTTSAPLSKRNLLTGAEIGTISSKPNQGEETWHTGMTKGFLCGMYNGAQNNQGAVVDYSSDTFTNNSTINRVGPPGSASGAGTEFGTLATGYDGI